MFNGEQVNDHIDNVVEDDGTHTLIHDWFNVRMNDDDDDDNENSYDFDNENDIPLLDKELNPFMKAPKQIFSLLYCW